MGGYGRLDRGSGARAAEIEPGGFERLRVVDGQQRLCRLRVGCADKEAAKVHGLFFFFSGLSFSTSFGSLYWRPGEVI